MNPQPVWRRLAKMVSSMLGMIVCAGLGLLLLGMILRIARSSPSSSTPMVIVGLMFVTLFASVVWDLIKRERGQ